MSARQLYELQELDGAIDSTRSRLADLEARLKDTSVIDALGAKVAALEQRTQEVRQRQRAQEQDLDSLRQKLQALEERLYGGKVSNRRELEGMERERKTLRSQLGRGEEELLRVMMSNEEAQRSLSDAQAELHREEGNWHKGQERLEKEKNAEEKTLERLLEERTCITSLLTEGEVAAYDRLRSAKKGQVAAKVERGLCRGCGVTLPTHVVQRARADRERVFCPSCGRVLYVS